MKYYHCLQWEVRPPMPSQVMRSIVKQIIKLHEALLAILPASQVEVCCVKPVLSLFFFFLKEVDKLAHDKVCIHGKAVSTTNLEEGQSFFFYVVNSLSALKFSL